MIFTDFFGKGRNIVLSTLIFGNRDGFEWVVLFSKGFACTKREVMMLFTRFVSTYRRNMKAPVFLKTQILQNLC
jgi:hypothetical protein